MFSVSSHEQLYLLSEFPQNSEHFRLTNREKTFELDIYNNGVMRDAIRFSLPKHPDYTYTLNLNSPGKVWLTFEQSRDFEQRRQMDQLTVEQAYAAMLAWEEEKTNLGKWPDDDPLSTYETVQCPPDCPCYTEAPD